MTKPDFGQNNFEEATIGIDNFLGAEEALFNDSGNLLREPPGSEVNLAGLLAGIPEWDSTNQTITLNQEELTLPPFLLEDINGVAMFFGRVTWNDPDLGTVTNEFAMGHQISKTVSESNYTLGILVLGILGGASNLKNKLKPSKSPRIAIEK